MATPLAICAARVALASVAVMSTMFALALTEVVIFCCRPAAVSPPIFCAAVARTVGEVTYAWSVARFSCVVVDPDAAFCVAWTEGATSAVAV